MRFRGGGEQDGNAESVGEGELFLLVIFRVNAVLPRGEFFVIVLSRESVAIQIDSLYNNPKFIKLREYINTLEDDERKGTDGYAK